MTASDHLNTPHGGELESVAPTRAHSMQKRSMRRLGQVRIRVDEGESCLTGLFEPETMMQQIPHVQFGQPGLLGTQEFSWTADL